MKEPRHIPPRVVDGDTVAIISPSLGGVGLWPHRVELGRSYLEYLGLRMKLMPNAGRTDGWVSASAKERADDIHTAFLDDDVSVVLASIGEELWRVVRDHTDEAEIPVLANVDCGHTDPMLTLPLGARARLDASQRELQLLDPPTD